MRDCENVDVRDLLPELLHERLPATERERVLTHVAGCTDCREELELLRATRSALDAGAPRVDVAAIARGARAALASDAAGARPELGIAWEDESGVHSRAVVPRGAPSFRGRRWGAGAFRAAAAVTLMAIGAAGVLVARRGGEPARRDTAVAVAPPAAVVAPAVPAPAPTQVAAGPSRTMGPHRGVVSVPTSALGATFSDLTDEELSALVRAVDDADGSLPADPEPLTVVGPSGATP